jgi:lipopolysaccharide transport system ATP-binding protein
MHAAVESAPPSAPARDAVIAVRGLGKRYEIYAQPRDRLLQSLFRGRRQFFQEFWALSDVSFDVARGETVGIIGRNGSGKSTLLQLIAGTLTPTTGSVAVQGRVAALLELGSGFNPEFSGRENVFLNGAILGLARSEIDARLATIVSFAGLEEFIDRPVKTYSSGMLMRLAFSVAVNVEPDVLIVDEALAVGDTAFQLKCVERLEQLTRSGVTLLFVSHDTALVKSFCARALYLERGRLKAQGKPEVITELYALDIRQAEGAQAGKPVALKPFVGDGDGIAFGTAEGRITAAAFCKTGTPRASSAYGDDLTFDVAVEFAADVAQPCLSVIVHDRQARELGGAYFPIDKPAAHDGVCRAVLRCGLDARLGAGPWSITLRLENRRSGQLSFPIDKQVGALVFEIEQPDRDAYFALVDLHLRCAPAPSGSANAA